MRSRVSSTWHADYEHCTAKLDFTHCDAHSTARRLDPDGGRVEAKWSLDADPQSASDADPRSVEHTPLFLEHCGI